MKAAPGARLYRRARILAPEPAPAGVDALATIGDRIVAVGPESTCQGALPADHEVIDLAGRTLVPGFIDAHLHPLVMSVFEQQLLLDGCRRLDDVLDLVADRAGRTEAGQTIVGFQLDEALLDERRLPTASELDRVAPGRAVVLVRRDGHNAVGSTAAIDAAGLAVPGSEPPGGSVERDVTGRPTGLVHETAVAPLLALLSDVTFEDLQSGMAAWSARLLRQGVTGISAICQTTEEGPSGPAGTLESVGWSILVEQLPFDIQTILIAPDLQAVHDLRADSPLHQPTAGRRVDAVKLFLDGTLGGCTACMLAPFNDRADTSGMRTMEDEAAYRRMVDAHLAGFSVCVHAIGDAANRTAAELFARLLREHPGPHRHRVEHASVLDDVTIELFATHGIAAVVQPINLRSEQHWLADRVGPERLSRTYPYRALLDAGVTVAGSSDAPIESTDVVAAMAATVDRGGLADEQAITPLEALGLYTTGASAVRGTEVDMGALAPGARADLVVLSADPTTSPDRASIEVLVTTIGGLDHYVHPDATSLSDGGIHG